MHPLEKETYTLIRQHNLLEPGEAVIVGVSGGPDSMALLHVLAALAPELELRLTAVYVDHGLRPDESPKEAALVAERAAMLNIDFDTEKVDVRHYAAQKKLSPEHAARLLRYTVLEEAAREFAADKIAVAHTADDQAEEVLLRLIRGTGRMGLAGMDMLRRGVVVRPFLAVPKERLLDYLDSNTIPFLIDSSNRNRRFLRNRVRLDLLPYLAEHFNPNIGDTLRQTATILRAEEELLEKMGQAAGRRIVEYRQAAAMSSGKPVTAVHIKPLLAEPLAIQRRVIETVLWRMRQQPGFAQIAQILHLAQHAEKGARLHLAHGLRIGREEDRLLFSYPQGEVSKRGDLTEKAKGKSFALQLNGTGVYALESIGKELHVAVLDQVPPAEDLSEPGTEYLDLGLLSLPLTVRSPQAGDRFHPLGAPGGKKVGDWLTDRKVDQDKRWQVPVLVSGDTVAALIGLRIDQRFRLRGATRRVLRIRIKPL